MRLYACLTVVSLLFLGSGGAQAVLPAPPAAQTIPLTDSDGDTLADDWEQRLLEQFLPTFEISQAECATLPAAFRPEASEPTVAAADGTVYGQVFPVHPPQLEGRFVEVHYYHLWARDCGRFGHELDSEYVSVLLRAEPVNLDPGRDDSGRTRSDGGDSGGNSAADRLDGGAGDLSDAEGDDSSNWKAVFWYAAAHEGTLCDSSNGARAEALGAVDHGATIWVSRGKHASYLAPGLCRRVGCGGDRCDEMIPLKPAQVINLGEPGRPMHGALWIDSDSWPLRSKMKPDFDDVDLSRFLGLKEGEVAILNGAPPPTHSLLLAGNKTIGALEVTDAKTGAALNQAGTQTKGATGVALRKSGHFFWRSLKAVGGALGIGKQDEQSEANSTTGAAESPEPPVPPPD